LFHCAAQSASGIATATLGEATQQAASRASADFRIMSLPQHLVVGLQGKNGRTGNPLQEGCVPRRATLIPTPRHNHGGPEMDQKDRKPPQSPQDREQQQRERQQRQQQQRQKQQPPQQPGQKPGQHPGQHPGQPPAQQPNQQMDE